MNDILQIIEEIREMMDDLLDANHPNIAPKPRNLSKKMREVARQMKTNGSVLNFEEEIYVDEHGAMKTMYRFEFDEEYWRELRNGNEPKQE